MLGCAVPVLRSLLYLARDAFSAHLAEALWNHKCTRMLKSVQAQSQHEHVCRSFWPTRCNWRRRCVGSMLAWCQGKSTSPGRLCHAVCEGCSYQCTPWTTCSMLPTWGRAGLCSLNRRGEQHHLTSCVRPLWKALAVDNLVSSRTSMVA